MKNSSTHLKLLVVSIIWGLGWVAGRVAALEIPPFTAGWVRYIIAVVFFLVFLGDLFLYKLMKQINTKLYQIKIDLESGNWLLKEE